MSLDDLLTRASADLHRLATSVDAPSPPEARALRGVGWRRTVWVAVAAAFGGSILFLGMTSESATPAGRPGTTVEVSSDGLPHDTLVSADDSAPAAVEERSLRRVGALGIWSLLGMTGPEGRWAFIVTEDGSVSAFRSMARTGGPFIDPAPTVADGVVYGPDGDGGVVVSVEATGEEICRVVATEFFRPSATPVVADGSWFVMTDSGTMYRFGARGCRAAHPPMYQLDLTGESDHFGPAVMNGVMWIADGVTLYGVDIDTGRILPDPIVITQRVSGSPLALAPYIVVPTQSGVVVVDVSSRKVVGEVDVGIPILSLQLQPGPGVIDTGRTSPGG